jgi:hypothetical protein
VRPILELASDVEVPSVLVAGWQKESVSPPPFVLFPKALITNGDKPVALPMTTHMRLWKWPAMVGPINMAGGRPQMTPTPTELPTVDSGLSLPVIPAWPRGDDVMAPTPTYGMEPTPTIPRPEQELMGIRNVWTRGHPTLPMRAPVLVGGFVGGSNVRFVIRGTTKDGTGTPLAACTVIALRSGEMAAPLDPDAVVVDVETSDAGGAYSVQVPKNEPHQLIGYKVGSPDQAGVTVNTVMPEYL